MENTYNKIYNLVRKIPEGRVCSYGIIAEYLGSKGGARLVGWAMNNAHNQEDYVPAHRVVNRNGMLTGKNHFGSPTLMQELLESEGVKIKDDKIVHFDDHLWLPYRDLT